MKPLRWFYMPNEGKLGDQVGPHKAFAALKHKGVFSALTSYSYLVERRKFVRHEDALQELFAAVEAFQPDVLFWQHLNADYPVDRAFLRKLKSVGSKPRLIWHDPDPYGRFIKPMDNVMKGMVAECDLAVVKGLGYFAELVRKAGAPRLLYAPESYDDERFAQPWMPTLERRFDAVMIANLHCLKRIPWLHMPGGRQRKVLSRLLHSAYGERFAVFGNGQGWRGERYCQGPIPFDAQERTIRQAWLSVNWGQFDAIPMYASDRLPISMASGIPHVCNHQPGYEFVFAGAPGLYLVRSPAEALDVVDMLLSLPRQRLVEIGAAGAQYARENLLATKVYGDLVVAIREQLFEVS